PGPRRAARGQGAVARVAAVPALRAQHLQDGVRVDLPDAGKATPRLVKRGHHVLDHGVVLERVDAQVLAIPRLLETPMWHLGDERDVVVDPDAAEPQRLGYA